MNKGFKEMSEEKEKKQSAAPKLGVLDMESIEEAPVVLVISVNT